ncbi:alpha/beta fold hydrolase [Streptomyces sp. TRM72054]|uniref:alpha/beta fold hydrolase n=1 Tax=Streptomyces sp. TRM72054 TaxID=2870562 RepID=UPI0021AB5311|nr:alpha/beta hydrolase [Streptomyces sp. TRM72054]
MEIEAFELNVRGACLHYDVCGSGPLLLLIPGAGGDGGVYRYVAERLASSFTVVTYDRRGNSRSSLEQPADELTIEDQGNDAQALIDVLERGPAYVIGSGAGAIIALDLLARHPDSVRQMVVHDPGVLDILPDADTYRALANELTLSFESEGPQVALGKLLSAVRTSAVSCGNGSPPDDCLLRSLAANPEMTFVHETKIFSRSQTDIRALASVSERLLIAVGSAHPESHPYRSGTLLAERTGARIVEIPGDHWSFLTDPENFADHLRFLLLKS